MPTRSAGTSAPINFNGLVRQYYLRRGGDVGDLQVNLVDKVGKSVVAANRPARVQYLYTVQKGSDGVFYVVQDKVVQTC